MLFQIKNLPSWLTYNKEGVLEGIPRSTDRGLYYLIVVAKGTESSAKDKFSISVKDVPHHKLLQEANCKHKSHNKVEYFTLFLLTYRVNFI